VGEEYLPPIALLLLSWTSKTVHDYEFIQGKLRTWFIARLRIGFYRHLERNGFERSQIPKVRNLLAQDGTFLSGGTILALLQGDKNCCDADVYCQRSNLDYIGKQVSPILACLIPVTRLFAC
jgi:hypothetical protein